MEAGSGAGTGGARSIGGPEGDGRLGKAQLLHGVHGERDGAPASSVGSGQSSGAGLAVAGLFEMRSGNVCSSKRTSLEIRMRLVFG